MRAVRRGAGMQQERMYNGATTIIEGEHSMARTILDKELAIPQRADYTPGFSS